MVVVCLCQVPCSRAEGGAYNTIRTLPRSEWPKVPAPSYPDGTFLQRCRAWSLVLCLTRKYHVVPCAHHYEGVGCTRRARRSLPSAIGQGGACPRPSGEAEIGLGCRARWSQPSDVGRGGAGPRGSGEAETALGGRARRNQSSVVRTRNTVAFSSDRKCQRSMVISSTSLGIPVLGPRQVSSVFIIYSVRVPRPLVTVSAADIPVLHSTEVVYFHCEL